MDIDEDFDGINVITMIDTVDKLVKIVESVQVEIDKITSNMDQFNYKLIGVDKRTDALDVVVRDLQDKLRNKED